MARAAVDIAAEVAPVFWTTAIDENEEKNRSERKYPVCHAAMGIKCSRHGLHFRQLDQLVERNFVFNDSSEF